MSRHCPTLKEWLENKGLKPYSTKYISAGSQNELVHLLAEDVRSRIKDEISAAGIYSVSADTTPDTSNQDKLVVASRFVDNEGVPCEKEELNILDALKLIDATVENLAGFRKDETAMNAQLEQNSKILTRCRNTDVTTKLDIHPGELTKIQQQRLCCHSKNFTRRKCAWSLIPSSLNIRQI